MFRTPVVLMVIPLIAFGCASTPSQVERHWLHARELGRSGQWREAVEACNKAIAIDPDYLPAFEIRGLAKSNAGFPVGEVLADLDTALQGKTAYRFLLRARARYVAGMHALAIEDCDQAIRYADANGFDPDLIEKQRASGKRVSIHHGGGLDKLFAQIRAEAVKLRATLAAKEDPAFYSSRGASYFKKGDYDKAIESYSTAIGMKKNVPTFHYGRGRAHAKKGEHDKAIRDFTAAIGMKKDAQAAYFHRAVSYQMKGQPGKAIEDFTVAIGLKTDDAMARFGRGFSYLNTRRHDKAIMDFTAAIELKNDDAGFYLYRGHAYSQKGDYNRAIKDFTVGLGLKNNVAIFYVNRGGAYHRIGDYDKAIEDISLAIGLKKDDPTLYFCRGSAYAKKGDYKNSAKDCQTALGLDPKHDRARKLLQSLPKQESGGE